MARIRSVKPEFWADEKIGPLEPIDRLVFLGLVSQADDAGRVLDNVRLLDGLLFPLTDDSCQKSLDTLARLSVIRRGVTISGQSVIQVVGWAKHQKIDHPARKGLLPPIEGERNSNADNDSRHPRETVATPSRDSRDTVATPSRDTRAPILDLGSRILDLGSKTLEQKLSLSLLSDTEENQRERNSSHSETNGDTEPDPVDDPFATFQPTDDERARARELGVDLPLQLRRWAAHRRAKRIRPADLHDDFSLWLERAHEFAPPIGATKHDTPPAVVSPPVFVADDSPPATPEEREAGRALVRAAMRAVTPPGASSSPPEAAAAAPTIDDPARIAERAARRERQREALAKLRAPK